MSDDLTAFLRARLAEDEAEAQNIHDVAFSGPDPGDCRCDVPARMLREVEAKRRLLAKHEHCSCPERLWLALVYSDHPDYQPQWS